MKRNVAILLGLLAVSMAVFASSFWASRTACEMCAPHDDLSWLKTEFHLSNAELDHVRQLHEGYLPQCAATCAKIAAKKTELARELAEGGTNISTEAQATLNEIAVLRAQCQAQMLQHFVTVSQAMPAAEGRRYLAEMQRLTLGLHDEMEQSMTDSAGHDHDH
jgi:hypothetical protein